MNFYEWIIKQRKRDDIVGDLAADIFRDKAFPKTAVKPDLDIYLGRHGHHVQQALDEAWEEFKTKRRRYVSAKVRFEVFRRDDFRCQLCGRTPPNCTLTIDHKVPVAQGGSSDQSNIWTLCVTCNIGKGASSL